MKPVVLYQSKYGATKRYAEWLSAALDCPALSIKGVNPEALAAYDTIIIGGGVYASMISGISFLQKNYALFAEKQIFVFAVGASPESKNVLADLRTRNLPGDLAALPLFYLRGAWNQSALSVPDKLICSMIRRSGERRGIGSIDEQHAAMLEIIGTQQDWTDRAALHPLLTALQTQEPLLQ